LFQVIFVNYAVRGSGLHDLNWVFFFSFAFSGKRLSQVSVRHEIHTAIPTVKRVRVTNYGGGMELHQKKEDLSMIVCGT